jgi:hypothetical protein
MAPFTAIFSQLIGGQRVTNSLTTLLCLAPLVGAALGTAVAPLCLRLADSLLFPLVALPAGIATAVLLAVWRAAGGPNGRTADPLSGRSRRRRTRSKSSRSTRHLSGEERGGGGDSPGARPGGTRAVCGDLFSEVETGGRGGRGTQLREPLLAPAAAPPVTGHGSV